MEEKTGRVEDKEKTEEIKSEPAVQKSNYSKQTGIIIAILVLFLAALFLVPYFMGRQAYFNYAGSDFEHMKFGELWLYHTKIPIMSITGQVVNQFNLYLRNDPRELEYIPIKGQIQLKRDVVVTADSSIVCPNEVIAGSTLSSFLIAAGLNVSIGTTNKTEAKELELNYVDCNSPDATVISFLPGNQTEIIRDRSCYNLYVSNCEIVPVAERFVIGTMAEKNGLGEDPKF
jgi:hypothetical protein